jgi:hypothetical protein
MRRSILLTTLPLLLASGSALRAQSPHMGFSLNFISPTGEFSSSIRPADALTPVPQRETYDLGLGGSFTVSFPMDRTFAMRLNFSGASNTGTNRATGYSSVNLRHSEFNVGGELQIFPQGTAFRHRGFYFLGGVSADFEEFTFGDQYNNSYYYDNPNTTRKSRLGGTAGFGNSFGLDAGLRFTMEVAFHKTLTGNSVAAGDPQSSDYVKVGIGVVF